MATHIPTMFLMVIAASGTLAFSVGWVARANDKEGLHRWTAALSVHTLVFVLFALRGQIPDFFSVLVANVALSVSYSLFLSAITQFQQRRVAPALLWAPPLAIAFAFSFLMSDISARIIVGGSIYVTQIVVVLFTLLRRESAVAGRGKHLMASGLFIMIATLLMRIVTTFIAPDSISNIMRETPVQSLTFMATFITLILVSNGFVLMTKERADERIRLMAMKDRLTGIWNRIRLEEAAHQEMARLERYGHPVSLIMADLDHFKEINDRFGHATGDLILKEFCTVTQGCIRSTDLLGRWGGEEFLVLLPNSSFSSTAQLAERIRATLEQHVFAGGHRITASFGFAVCQSTDSWDSWLDRADKALYRAKAGGRNRVETECLAQGADKTGVSDTHFVQLVWRKAYESGNAQIDTQHRTLFELSNALLKAILDNRPKPEITQMITELVAEIDQHFRDEEVVFQRAAYPDTEHHRALHAHLVQRATQLASRFERDQVGVGELFHYLAYEVVAQHMLIEDRKFFPLLAA